MTGIMTVWHDDNGGMTEMTPELTVNRRGMVEMPILRVEGNSIFLGENGPLEINQVRAIALTYKRYSTPKNQMEAGSIRSDIYLAEDGFRKVLDIRRLKSKGQIVLKVQDDSRRLNRKVGRK